MYKFKFLSCIMIRQISKLWIKFLIFIMNEVVDILLHIYSKFVTEIIKSFYLQNNKKFNLM